MISLLINPNAYGIFPMSGRSGSDLDVIIPSSLGYGTGGSRTLSSTLQPGIMWHVPVCELRDRDFLLEIIQLVGRVNHFTAATSVKQRSIDCFLINKKKSLSKAEDNIHHESYRSIQSLSLCKEQLDGGFRAGSAGELFFACSVDLAPKLYYIYLWNCFVAAWPIPLR